MKPYFNTLVKFIYKTVRGVEIMGWGLARNTDFNGHQMEIVAIFAVFIVIGIWVYYDSDKYFVGIKRHIFWGLTILTGPIGLIIYLIQRKKEELV